LGASCEEEKGRVNTRTLFVWETEVRAAKLRGKMKAGRKVRIMKRISSKCSSL